MLPAETWVLQFLSFHLSYVPWMILPLILSALLLSWLGLGFVAKKREQEAPVAFHLWEV